MPQEVMPANGSRSQSRFSETPWLLTPRVIRRPIEPIFLTEPAATAGAMEAASAPGGIGSPSPVQIPVSPSIVPAGTSRRATVLTIAASRAATKAATSARPLPEGGSPSPRRSMTG